MAQKMCKQLVKDLIKAWVRDPIEDKGLEKRLSGALTEEDIDNREEPTGELGDESIEVVAANRVATLNAQLEKLKIIVAQVNEGLD